MNFPNQQILGKATFSHTCDSKGLCVPDSFDFLFRSSPSLFEFRCLHGGGTSTDWFTFKKVLKKRKWQIKNITNTRRGVHDLYTVKLKIPVFASKFNFHHDDLPVPSFCSRTKRLCSDRLCLIEFCNKTKQIKKIDDRRNILCFT